MRVWQLVYSALRQRFPPNAGRSSVRHSGENGVVRNNADAATGGRLVKANTSMSRASSCLVALPTPAHV